MSGKPSWLELERYALGELSKEDAARVKEAIASDPDTAAIAKQIQDGAGMPPVPRGSMPPAMARPSLPPETRKALFSFRWVPAFAAAAAVVAFVVFVPESPTGPNGSNGAGMRIKGDNELSASVVVERDGQRIDAPSTFMETDRLKVRVTCAPPHRRTIDVVVFQGSETSFPLSEPVEIACGNDVPLPGAFRLTPEPADICILGAPDLVDHADLTRLGQKALPASADCVSLAPATP